MSTQVHKDQHINTPQAERKPVTSVSNLLVLGYGKNPKVTFWNFQGYRIDFIMILNAPLIETLRLINDGLLFYQVEES